MNTLVIPLSSQYPKHSFRVQLDGTPYIFRMRWNKRIDRWMLSISDSSDNMIVSGINCCVRTDLLAQYKHLKVPQGLLMFYNLKDKNVEPQYESIDADVILSYTVSG